MKKTVKNKYHIHKCDNVSKKSMIGGGYIEISQSLVSKTKTVFDQTRNYLEINDRSRSYYTKLVLSDKMTQISYWANYGLNPGLDGVFIERLQPYIIYLVMYYYISILFSQLFNRNNNITLYKKEGSSIDIVDKDDLQFVIGNEYYLYASIQSMDNVLTILNNKSNIVLKFIFSAPNNDPLLIISDIFIVGIDSSRTNESNHILDTITQLSSSNLKSVKKTSDTFTNELRKKTLQILKTSINFIQRIISKQISSSSVLWLMFDGTNTYELNSRDNNRNLHIINEYINSNIIIVLPQIETIILKTSNTVTSNKNKSQSLSAATVIVNPIPTALNVYLSSTSSSPIQIDNVLLTSDMLLPSGTKDNLRINPRNPLKDMNDVLAEFCKANKIENPISVFFDKSLFLKFNAMYKKKSRVRTLKQAIDTNLDDNISNTLKILLSGSELQLTQNGTKDLIKINSYFWNNQWYLSGSRDVLLSIEAPLLQSTVQTSSNPSTITSCYSQMIEVLNDLIDLFYPSMAGKDITKTYTKYLQTLNERNNMVDDVKHLINSETLSISTTNLSDKYKDTISNIHANSVILKNIIKEFIKNVIYQLVIIQKIITKIINRIQTNCFIYYVIGINDTNNIQQPSDIKLFKLISNRDLLDNKDTMNYLSFLEEGYQHHEYINLLSCSKSMTTQYNDISSAFDNVVTTVITQLNSLSQRMLTITNNDNTNTTFNTSNESLDTLWISNEEIEKCFTTFETVTKSFVKSNLPSNYYSQEYIEKMIDNILWDMDVTPTMTYSRLVTSFVDKNIWNQLELLFAMKAFQYIFLIYKYTGKYVAYYNIDITKIDADIRFESFVYFLSPSMTIPSVPVDEDSLKRLNLFSFVMNWYKYICCKQTHSLILKKGRVSLQDIRELFMKDTLIKQSYLILKYYIVNIILSNIDVCQLSNDLHSMISILAPTDADLKQYTSSSKDTITDKSRSETDVKSSSSTDKSSVKESVSSANELAFNVVVQVSVSKDSDKDSDKDKDNGKNKDNGKLSGVKAYNIDDLLGCKKIALGLKWDSLKHSTNQMVGNSLQQVTDKIGKIFEPNLSIIDKDFSVYEKGVLEIPIKGDDSPETKSVILEARKKRLTDTKNAIMSPFKNPQYQILVTVPEFVIEKGLDLGIDVDKFMLELTKLGNNSINKSFSNNSKNVLDTTLPTDLNDVNLMNVLLSVNIWAT